eukprot:evm.model.NODE_5105_length_3359_cov_35.038700.1
MGGLSLVSLEHGQAVSLWITGIHDLATLKGKGAVLMMVLLHGREKAVGMLEMPSSIADALKNQTTEAAASPENEESIPVIYKRVGRRWRERQEEAMTAVVESLRSVVVKVKEIEGDESVNVGSAILALAALEYEVRLVASSGLGLDLAFVGNGVVVRELAFLADGRPSPAQLCGRIRPGDALLAVNGMALERLALKDKLAVLLALAGEHDTEISLRFMAKEASSWTRSLINLGLGATDGAEGSAQKEEINPFLPMVEPIALSHPQQPRPPSSSLSVTPAPPSTPSTASTSHEQQRAMEKMVELGLAAPKPGQSSGADHLRQQQSVVQHFLTSTLLPWKTRFWEDGGKGGGGGLLGLGRTHAGMASCRKKWGEFGQSEMSLGLMLAAEEMESDLDRIARDVRTVWTTEERASESRFYDDNHRFAALLGQSRAASESCRPLHEHKKIVAERRLGRAREGVRAIRGKRDRLLYFKDLLKTSVAYGQGHLTGRSKTAKTVPPI